MITKLPPALRRVWQFGQTYRDEWVAARAAEVAPGSRVLDIGAGSCPYRPLFAHCDYRAHDFAALDQSQLPAGYGALDYVSDIRSIPAEEASFDVILCTEVLEHVPEPAAATREMARLLKDGGRLLLTAPLGASIHQQPYHFYGGYTPYWYEHVLSEQGFVDIRVEPNGGFFRHYGQESIRFAQLLAPRRLTRSRVGAALLLPLWLPVAAVFAGAFPFLCHVLDRFDRSDHHTVGYHVSAIRRRAQARSEVP